MVGKMCQIILLNLIFNYSLHAIVVNRFGKEVAYMYLNCENHIYIKNKTLDTSRLLIVGGFHNGTMGKDGIKIIPTDNELKLIFYTSKKNIDTTIVFEIRRFNSPKISMSKFYSLSRGFEYTILHDMDFAALCPNDLQYEITFSASVCYNSIRKCFEAESFQVKTGRNIIFLSKSNLKYEHAGNCRLVIEARALNKRRYNGTYYGLCTSSLYYHIPIQD